MKNQIYISQKWRKLTAVLLLLNFFVAPLLNAFPQEECDSACEIVMPLHDCSSEDMQEDTCCDVMSMSNSVSLSSTSTECGMKISDINCSILVNEQNSTSYIIPKTIDNKIDLIILPMFSVDEDNSLVLITNYSQEMFTDSSPPIYLMISSFLN